MSNAMIGHGILVRMRPVAGAWTTLSEVFNAAPPSDSDDLVDVTHYQSPSRRREFISGLIDGGEVSFEMNHVPGSATDLFMIAASGSEREIEITYPNGVKLTFGGIRQGYEVSSPVDDKITATASFKVTGAVTQSAAAAPTNVILPAVSGVPQVGVVLTALPGDWTGTGQFTYQWKKSGVNIGGATASTYTPVVGDIGAPISVAVTGTNSAGSATATSTNTINVVAA
jgi:Lambda phage tail tube protein, TTP